LLFAHQVHHVRNEKIRQYFYLQKGKQDLGEFKMQIIGRHNVENATAVIATCLELKISLAKVKRALAKFKGTARRMEILGKYHHYAPV